MKIYGIIYMIRNKINDKIYIGQTIQKFNDRYTSGDIRKTHNEHLKRSIDKYGIENFYVDKEFDIAYSKEELDKLEDMYIVLYKTTDKNYGYNSKRGGSNGKHTEEVKEKLSISHKNKKLPEKQKEKIRKSLLEKAFKRKVVCVTTGEIFESITEASKKHNTLDSSISSCCNGKRKKTIDSITNEILCWKYYEDYIKMDKAEIDEYIKKCNKNLGPVKKIYCITTGETFVSIKDASNKYNICDSVISRACKGKIKSAGKLENGEKLYWKYL